MSLRRGATQDGTSTGTATEHATQQPMNRVRLATERIDVNAFQDIMHLNILELMDVIVG